MSGRNVKVRKVISVLEKNGFKLTGRDKHGNIYTHTDGRETTIGAHYKNGTIPVGTLKTIEKQTRLKFN
jgi:predicted RNA binding protein YcfA (HicA-like mRNA interferase family)